MNNLMLLTLAFAVSLNSNVCQRNFESKDTTYSGRGIATPGYSDQLKADIKEAVFRFQFKRYGHKPLVQVFFLGFGFPLHKAPSKIFMKRFAANSEPVLPFSRMERGVMEARDKITKRKGILFWSATVKLINSNTAELLGGYHYGGRDAIVAKYVLVKVGSKWIVEKELVGDRA